MRWRLASRLALLLAVIGCGACGSDGDAANAHDAASAPDAACWTAHQCAEASCCDPVCAGAHPSNAYGCPEEACSNVGYQCFFFEYICTCGADGTWQYQNNSSPGQRDLSPPTD